MFEASVSENCTILLHRPLQRDRFRFGALTLRRKNRGIAPPILLTGRERGGRPIYRPPILLTGGGARAVSRPLVLLTDWEEVAGFLDCGCWSEERRAGRAEGALDGDVDGQLQ